jgi:hypothetical protein
MARLAVATGSDPGAAEWPGSVRPALAAAGAAVVSGFWSVVNERFDPHTARRVLLLPAAATTRILLLIAAVMAGLTMVRTSRPQRGYVGALADSLRAGSLHLDPGDVMDQTTRAALAASAAREREVVVALRAWRSDGRSLRGIALEYLENVLPSDLWAALSPWLGARPAYSGRTLDAIRDDLLRSTSALSLARRSRSGPLS